MWELPKPPRPFHIQDTTRPHQACMTTSTQICLMNPLTVKRRLGLFLGTSTLGACKQEDQLRPWVQQQQSQGACAPLHAHT